MVDLNRMLCVALVGYMVMDAGLTLTEGKSLFEMIYVPTVIPVVWALLGRGSRLLYDIAMILAWLYSLLLLLIVVGIIEAIAGFVTFDVSDLNMHMILLFGTLSLASYFCISHTHPAAGMKTALDRKLGKLKNSILFSLIIIFGSGMLMLCAGALNPDWSYPEIVWVCWYDTLIAMLFFARVMRKLKVFVVSDITAMPRNSDEAIKQRFITANTKVS